MGMMEAITAEPMLYGGILAASLLLIGVVGVVMKKKKKAPAAPAKALFRGALNRLITLRCRR